MIEFLLFIVAYIFVLFILYKLAKNDFVLLRKNVSLYELFDAVLISMIVGLVISRIFFILDIQNLTLFNPFRFFHLIKIPGLSLYGFYVGVVPILYFLLRKKKVITRVFDIVSISVFPLFIFSLLTREYTLAVPELVVKGVLCLAGLVLISIFIRFFENYTLKDGSIALIIFMFVSIDTLLYGFIAQPEPWFFGLTLSQIFSILLFISSLVFLTRNQNVLKKK